jgi:hypothetical protein
VAAEHAPGAIPPTEGVPPRSGAPSNPDGTERTATEDLADALELLRRAARKTLREVDPQVERLAERAAMQLRELDEQATVEFEARKAQLQELERATEQAGKVILGAVEKVIQSVDRVIRGSARSPEKTHGE